MDGVGRPREPLRSGARAVSGAAAAGAEGEATNRALRERVHLGASRSFSLRDTAQRWGVLLHCFAS